MHFNNSISRSSCFNHSLPIIELFPRYKDTSCQKYSIDFEFIVLLTSHSVVPNTNCTYAFHFHIRLRIILCLDHQYPSVLLPAVRSAFIHPCSTRLSSFRHVSDSVSLPLNFRSHPAIIRRGSVSTAKGNARERVKPDRNNFEFG